MTHSDELRPVAGGRLKLGVLVSGGGSNLQSIIDRVEDGVLDAEIALVASNNPKAYGLERARLAGLPTFAAKHTEYPSREAFDTAIVSALKDAGATTIALAGYMRLVTPSFLNSFPGRVVNIHPALLPAFPGVHGQRDAAYYAVKLSGCTVHFVDEIMDHGPVIVQAAVPVLPGDDEKALGARILAQEHRIYPQALQWLAEGRIGLRGREVLVTPPDSPDSLAAPARDALVNPPLEKGF